MAILAVECGNCGAKLKIRAGALRTPAGVTCPKCRKTIPIPKGTPAPAAPETAAETIPDEAVPRVAEPAVVSAPPPLPVTPPAPPAAPEAVPVPVPAPATPRKAAAPIVLSHLGEQHGPLSVPVKCPACQWQTKVREELIGKKIRCRQCGAVVLVVAPPGDTAKISQESPATVPVVPSVVASAEPVVPVPAAAEPPSVPVFMPDAAPTSLASPVVDSLVQEVALAKTQLIQIKQQRDDAERRAALAEKAFHDVTAQRLAEAAAAGRRLSELESQVSAMRAQIAELKTDMQSELDAATKRVSLLQQRLDRMG